MVESIYIVTSDGTLGRVLQRSLEREGRSGSIQWQANFDGITGPSMVITTERDCPMERCSELTRRHVSVVILAALPTDARRDSYRTAGAAAYVPMSSNTQELEGALQGLHV